MDKRVYQVRLNAKRKDQAKDTKSEREGARAISHYAFQERVFGKVAPG